MPVRALQEGASPSQRLSHGPGKWTAAGAYRSLADAKPPDPAADQAAGSERTAMYFPVFRA